MYCSTSFVHENAGPASAPAAAVPAVPVEDPIKKRRAMLVSIAVFLTVMSLGLYLTAKKAGRAPGTEVAASTYALRDTPLKLQPNSSAGSSTTLNGGTVVALTGIAVDPEGRRWYVLHKDHEDGFLKVTDVAPPKAKLPDLGAQMLRAWLLVQRDPELVPEADSAVAYYCSQFPTSSHCDELRMVAAEQFQSLSKRTNSQDALVRSRHLYQAVVDGKGPGAAEASRKIEELEGNKEERTPSRRSKGNTSMSTKNSTLGSGREYALIDQAEVHVKVPDLNGLKGSEQLRTPIAREIRINGKVAVPSNATCILKVSGRNPARGVEVQLVAIEFGNKRYEVATNPQSVPVNGAMVTFPLESSLLVGR
ncbi:MAG: hypothetical protein ACM3JB_04005 [Acidobacteriaceae bacterium]